MLSVTYVPPRFFHLSALQDAACLNESRNDSDQPCQVTPVDFYARHVLLTKTKMCRGVRVCPVGLRRLKKGKDSSRRTIT